MCIRFLDKDKYPVCQENAGIMKKISWRRTVIEQLITESHDPCVKLQNVNDRSEIR